MHKVSFVEYNECIFDYLEYIGYPEYILNFDPEQVARSLSQWITIMYEFHVSYRSAALTIFGITWQYQIVPSAKKMTIQ